MSSKPAFGKGKDLAEGPTSTLQNNCMMYASNLNNEGVNKGSNELELKSTMDIEENDEERINPESKSIYGGSTLSKPITEKHIQDFKRGQAKMNELEIIYDELQKSEVMKDQFPPFASRCLNKEESMYFQNDKSDLSHTSSNIGQIIRKVKKGSISSNSFLISRALRYR